MRQWVVFVVLAVVAIADATTTPNSRNLLQRQQQAGRQADRDVRHQEGECMAGACVNGQMGEEFWEWGCRLSPKLISCCVCCIVPVAVGISPANPTSGGLPAAANTPQHGPALTAAGATQL